MSKLRERLARLRKPVEVDAIGDVVDDAERAVGVQVNALTNRIADAIVDLRQHRDEVSAMAAKVDALDDATGVGKGLMATLRASFADDEVEESRAKAARDLAGVCVVLERRVQRALALSDDTGILREDVGYAIDALQDLASRANGADLHREARLVERAISRLRALDAPLQHLDSPLVEPVRQTQAMLNKTMKQAGKLRATERAATVGEAVLDGVLSPRGGHVSRSLREAVGEAVPSLVPDVERYSEGHEDVLGEMDAQLRRVRESARKEEELRRAAEAELDALEWDP
ncbi:MAG: hypothetical protein HN348_02420 [Proteobacteria bacterium]|nr:hypothetical protein [Pseudomonadota bacterium]